MRERLGRLLASVAATPSGATSIEYAMIAALISVAIVAGVTLLGTNVKAMFDNLAAAMP